MKNQCRYCRCPMRRGDHVVYATECRLERANADGYSVAFDVQSENLVVHRACWDRMLAGRHADVPVVPDVTDPVETDEWPAAPEVMQRAVWLL